MRFIEHSACRVLALKWRLSFVHLSRSAPPPNASLAPSPVSRVNVTHAAAAPPPAAWLASETSCLKEQGRRGVHFHFLTINGNLPVFSPQLVVAHFVDSWLLPARSKEKKDSF